MNTRKKVAVNTRFLIQNKLEGIGNFTNECLMRIVAAHPAVDFYFLFDREYSAEFIFSENVYPVILYPPARHPILWFLWFEFSVRQWLNKNKPDLFLSPDGFGCLGSAVPQVLVMHDIAYEHYGENVSFLTRQYYRYFMPRFARKAARLATVSEFSKQDISRQYKISSESIDVVYSGVKTVYSPVEETIKKIIRNRYAEGCKYFVFVGIIHPRKNIPRLLEAFEQFKKNTDSDYKLIITGRKAWTFAQIETTLSGMKHRSEVLFPGYLSNEEVALLIGSAECIMYVSLFEGFGVPILEAMKCEVPVITSNSSSMPEIAGNAALIVDPLSKDEIALAMQRIISDEALRKILIDRGKEQAKLFSWDFTARKLWECCKTVIYPNTNHSPSQIDEINRNA